MDLTQNIQETQKIVADLLKDLPADSEVEVELPSECRAYKLIDPAAPVTIRPLTFEDEKSMLTGGKGADPVNIVLQRCVSNVSVGDLLPMDKMFLLLKLREISYGDDYTVMLLCPECNGENEITVKLSDLTVNPVPDDFTGVEEVFLKGIKKKVTIRLPRVKDERYITSLDDIETNLWRFVSAIEKYTDPAVIAQVIKKLPVRDIKTIMAALKTDYGVERKVKLDCRHCKAVSVVDLPISENFFEAN